MPMQTRAAARRVGQTMLWTDSGAGKPQAADHKQEDTQNIADIQNTAGRASIVFGAMAVGVTAVGWGASYIANGSGNRELGDMINTYSFLFAAVFACLIHDCDTVMQNCNNAMRNIREQAKSEGELSLTRGTILIGRVFSLIKVDR